MGTSAECSRKRKIMREGDCIFSALPLHFAQSREPRIMLAVEPFRGVRSHR